MAILTVALSVHFTLSLHIEGVKVIVLADLKYITVEW